MKWNWNKKWSWLLFGLVIAAGAYGGYVAWFAGDRMDLGAGFASANGRIEGVEIDVAAKTAGRVTAVLVDEGDFVNTGDVLARMDTAVLAAGLREAQAQLRQAKSSVAVAHSQVTQRESERRQRMRWSPNVRLNAMWRKNVLSEPNPSPSKVPRVSSNWTMTGRPFTGQWRH